MSKQTMSLHQIREVGLEALTKALGPVGMVRFLQQFLTLVTDTLSVTIDRHGRGRP
ncbi:MAG: hypothetical protein ACE5K2_00500 [Candidatus Zixiibacteriota bacterium]